MAEHPFVTLAKKGYEAFRTGDMATLGEVFADDVVFHVPGKSILANSYQGKAATFGYFGKLFELTNGTIKVESLNLYVSDDQVVMLDRMAAERNGKTIDTELVLVLKVRDGQFVEGWDHFADLAAWDEFWA
ncbi:MAG: nuclear transport factor 2 family protein [Blastocatellia bacterium]|nr:nuclear transport factor 2 family protein [Blastocatellia bacterium]